MQFLVYLLAIFLLNGCSGDGVSVDGLGLSVTFAASRRLVANSPCTSGATTDTAGTTAGLDCDSDGGGVAYQTPTSYTIAFKSIYFLQGTTKKYLINFDSLDAIDSSGIFTFTPSETTSPVTIPTNLGELVSIEGIGFEIYYFQVEITMYGQSRSLRIYMSDDDFSSQGSGGHHQGDITYFDSNGTEHWAKGGENWFGDDAGTLARGDFANGAGGVDSETGHARGMFGDADFWNAADLQQGSEQDIYFSELSLTGSNSSVTLSFDVINTWFYENFSDTFPNSFDPCQGSTGEGCGGEWAPLFPATTASN